MRRREWFGWSASVVVGVAVFALSLTVAARQPWEHYTEPLGAVAIGSGLGQLIRGWWHVRQDRLSSGEDADR